ncbi:MAG: hypothetical protein M1837_000723 [Sclerophora amabilis]|nr:MAG: hypothetical protein M1837_000723 [Sclerophora amabilis]
MAPQPPPQHPLDVLPAMVNGVLLQTAKVFRDPARRDPKNLGYTNTQMRSIIPGFQARFHSALDELEVEILRAKATIERDLREAKARRAEGERQAIAERHRLDKESGARISPKAAANDEGKPNGQDLAAEDVIMTDGLPDTTEKPTGEKPPRNESTQPADPVETKVATPPQVAQELSNNSKAETNASPEKQDASANITTGYSDGAATTNEAAPAAEPQAADGSTLDIDSMFADTGNNAAFSFDLDSFPTDQTLDDPNLDAGDAFADSANAVDTREGDPVDDLNLFGDSGGAGGGGASGDNEEMLPGLRSYANAPEEDDAMELLGIPTAPATTVDSGGNIGAATSSVTHNTNNNINNSVDNAKPKQEQGIFDPSNVPTDLLPDTSTFDELFDASGGGFDLEGDGGTGTGDGTLGTGNEFDDWMNFGS